MKYKLCRAQGQRNVVMCAEYTDEVLWLSGPRGCLLGQNNMKNLQVNQSASFVVML